MKRCFRICCMLIISALKLQAQPVTFSHFTVDNGLSQSVANDVYQDSERFIWVGTQDGISRFDGYGFTKFIHVPIDTNSLSNNWIFSIAEDHDKCLWFGTRGGLNKYDKKTGLFTRFKFDAKNNNTIANDVVYGVAVDKDGNIWANTPPFLNKVETKTGKISRFENKFGFSSAIGDQRIPLLIDRNNLVWMATNEGLASFNPDKKQFTTYQRDSINKKTLSNNSVTALYQDKKGNIWVGTRDGLNRIDKNDFSIKRIFIKTTNNPVNDNLIRSITEDIYGNFWIGTEGSGLIKLTFSDAQNYTYQSFHNITTLHPNYICNDFVLSLIIDKSNNLWIGTLNGLDKTDLKPKKFELYRKSEGVGSLDLLDNVIASIYKDSIGNIWVGNWGKGLNIINRSTGKVIHYSKNLSGKNNICNDYVHVIFEDSKKNIWIGTRDGIEVFNKTNQTFVPIETFYRNNKITDFKGKRIFEIVEDDLKNIWIGTNDGVYMIDIKNNDFKHYTASPETPFGISDNLVYCLMSDADCIWIGTANGLDCFDYVTKGFTHFRRDEKSVNTLCDNFIVSLGHDEHGDVWIGTKSGVSFYSLKTKTFTYYSERDGLPSNVVYEIQHDSKNNLWFATGRGLSKFNPETKIFRNFTIEDGLQSMEFNLRASYKSKDGEMFFGGMNGFNSFFADSLRENKFVPQVTITKFEKVNSNGKHLININSTNEITLYYSDYEFTIEFAMLEFTHPEKNLYKYKMQGLANNWIDLGNRRFVPFSNLPAGDYTFQVMGTNDDGIWNPTPTILKITVQPPFWKTNWAFAIYIIILGLSIYLIIVARERNLKHQKEVLEIKVRERTIQVERQKNEILLKNAELVHKNEEIIAQRDEIEAQRDMVTNQRDKIARQNKQITDSIKYAERIQSAMLTVPDGFDNLVKDYFIFYSPKDIVSGDFYWIKQINNFLIFTVADCTGHGVPGAFMSMLGISFLNEIVRRKEIKFANEALNELRLLVKSSLGQTGKDFEAKDGMDIAFCVFDFETRQLQFSGAYNPLYVLRENEIIEIKGNPMPIGIHARDESFTNNIVEIQEDDIVYLFSDGYKDQFGIGGRKFLSKNFKQLLLDNCAKPMNLQQTIFSQSLNEWKGTREQIDDILVIGIKLI